MFLTKKPLHSSRTVEEIINNNDFQIILENSSFETLFSWKEDTMAHNAPTHKRLNRSTFVYTPLCTHWMPSPFHIDFKGSLPCGAQGLRTFLFQGWLTKQWFNASHTKDGDKSPQKISPVLSKLKQYK